jgi:hypothetical protein
VVGGISLFQNPKANQQFLNPFPRARAREGDVTGAWRGRGKVNACFVPCAGSAIAHAILDIASKNCWSMMGHILRVKVSEWMDRAQIELRCCWGWGWSASGLASQAPWWRQAARVRCTAADALNPRFLHLRSITSSTLR